GWGTGGKGGFKARTILAAPMRTPKGEIVGVVEILNKRQRVFTKEDEEFLAEVGTHSALAVESVRQHEASLADAHQAGAAEVLKTAQQFLAPNVWPATPGFESAPLRWRSGGLNLVSYAGGPGSSRIGFLLLEARPPP